MGKHVLRGRDSLDSHRLGLLLDLERQLAVEILDGVLVGADRLEVRHVLGQPSHGLRLRSTAQRSATSQ